MYDMTKYIPRYYEMKFKNGVILNLEPPKIKMLKRIAALSEVKDTNNLKEEDISNLTEAMSIALSKNKQNYIVSANKIEEEFDIIEIMEFLEDYINWVNEIQSSKN